MPRWHGQALDLQAWWAPEPAKQVSTAHALAKWVSLARNLEEFKGCERQDHWLGFLGFVRRQREWEENMTKSLHPCFCRKEQERQGKQVS